MTEPLKPCDRSAGACAAAVSFILWGLLPVYWKALDHVPAFEIYCQRILWSLVSVALFLAWRGGLVRALGVLGQGRSLAFLTGASAAIGINWLLYIWAVNAGFVLETALGFYINPLVLAVMGRVFYRDRLRPWQQGAVVLAGLGVAALILFHGAVPWIALVLAVNFATYGLLRKMVQVEAVEGLLIETLILAVPAGLGLMWLSATRGLAFGNVDMATDALLIGAGPATALPLALFAVGARQIRLTTLGLLQFIAPTEAFLLGVFAYGEEFTLAHLAAFSLIWIGVGLYALDGMVAARRSPGGGPESGSGSGAGTVQGQAKDGQAQREGARGE